MASERSIKVTIVNRYYPNSVTGESAFELVNFLESNSAVIDVNSISVNSQYKGNKKSVKENEGNYYIPSFYHGNKKFFRLLANLYEGYSLIKKAKNINSDLVICLTDPPLVNFWAAILLKNNTPWILWSMDVYPDAFNAAGLVGENNFILRYLKRKIKKNSPNYLIALGDSQNSYLKNGFNDSIQNTFILPCGIHEEKSSKDKPVWYDESKITFAYAGNLGEAHSDRFLKNVIENLDPVKHQLILSVYGSKSSNIIRLIDNY